MENSFKTPDGLRSRYAPTDVEEGLTKQLSGDVDDDENDDDGIIDVYGNHSAEEDRYHYSDNRGGNASLCLSLCDSITPYIPCAPIQNRMVRCKQRCLGTTRKGNVSSCRCRGVVQQVSSPEGVWGCFQVIYNLLHTTSRTTAVRTTYSTVSTPIRSNRTTVIPPSTTMVTSETDDEETPPEIEDWNQKTPPPEPPKKPVPSVEVPQIPKLNDYTKSRAKLPDKVPLRIDFCSDWGQDMDDEDDESTTEEDLLLTSQGKPSNEKVEFLLRLPNRRSKHDDDDEDDGQQRKKPAIVRTFSNSSRSNIQGLVRTLSSELLQKQKGESLLGRKKASQENLRDMLKAELQGNSQHGSSSRSNRSNLSNNKSSNNNINHSNHRRHEVANRNRKMNRRGSGDTAGSTSRNIFIAPFPKPLSRENSLEGLNEMSRNTRSSPRRTPTSLRSRSLRDKEFVRSMLNGTKSNVSLGGSQSERGRYNNGSGDNLLPADTVMLLNDLSGHSDEDKTSSRRRGGGRMNRRGSFVKGSKIERFDGSNDSQSRVRRALQRREAVKKHAAEGGGGSSGS